MRRYVRIRTYVNTYVRAYATWLITFGHLRLRAYVRTYVRTYSAIKWKEGRRSWMDGQGLQSF